MDIPNNQIAFEKMFATEEQCIDYVIGVRWENGFVCPSCGHGAFWKQSRRRICCKQCRTKISVLSGTLFEQTNKSLSLWFRVIWSMIAAKNGMSALGLQRIMGFGGYQTAWSWLHKLRRLCILPDRSKLTGKVEVDETFLGGKREGKRGRGAAGKILVAIAVEVVGQRTGRVRLGVIADATKKSLQEFIEMNVEKGSEIVTDGWNAYKDIPGYTHTVSDKKQEVESETVLPNVHRVASLLKRWQLGTHQTYITGPRAQNYLDEFTFRYNRRTAKSRGLLFGRIMKHAVHHAPILYQDISNEKPKGKQSAGKS